MVLGKVLMLIQEFFKERNKGTQTLDWYVLSHFLHESFLHQPFYRPRIELFAHKNNTKCHNLPKTVQSSTTSSLVTAVIAATGQTSRDVEIQFVYRYENVVSLLFYRLLLALIDIVVSCTWVGQRRRNLRIALKAQTH